MSANRIAPDGKTRFAVSHLGLFRLPSSIKRTPGVYGLIAKVTRKLAPSRLLDGYLSNSKIAGRCFYSVNATSAKVISTDEQN